MSEAKWVVKPCSAGGAIVDRGIQQTQIFPIADAHLIASAPAMYEALEKTLRDAGWPENAKYNCAPHVPEWVLNAQAALAQARGEAL